MGRSNRTNEEAFSKVQGTNRKRRFGKLRVLAISLLVLLIAAVIAVPFVASNASLVSRLANQYGGVEPLKIQIQSVNVGWFSPMRASGVRILDERGIELLKVGEVETQIALWNLISDYTNLRNIYVRQTRLAIDVQPGTTSVEEAIKPLLAKWSTASNSVEDETAATSTASTEFTGTIQIEDASVLARDSVSGAHWEFSLSNATIPLPTTAEPIPALQIAGRIAEIDAAGNVNLRSTGQFEAKLETINANSMLGEGQPTASNRMVLKLNTSGMPLDWIALVKRRYPQLPIDNMSGSATVQTDIDIDAIDNITARIATAQIDRLRIDAADLLGSSGASLNQVRLVGDVQLNGDQLRANQLQLTSDVGYIRASAQSSISPTLPTLAEPWIPNAEFTIDGELDLSRLVQVAPDLIPMRDQAKLTSGKATMSLRQTPPAAGSINPSVVCNLRLGSLLAEYQGSKLQWDEALQLEAQLLKSDANNSNTPGFQVNCIAEFCDITGEGTLHDGQIKANINLDKLEKRLAQWINLPTKSLAGSANATIVWNQQAQDRIVASADIESSPLTIVLPSGRLDEPAWKGQSTVGLQLVGMEVVQVDRASLKLSSTTESIDVAVNSPFRIVPAAQGSPDLPVTKATATVKCDLAACSNRARILAGVNLGMGLAGFCDLQVDAALDELIPVIQNATYDLTDVKLRGDGYSINENRIQGRFRGSVHPMDIAATRVDELIVQAPSFALSARDSAAEQQGYLRNGQAAFRIDPTRLMKNYQTEPASTSNIVCSGDVTGQMQWLLNSERIDWQISVDGKDISIDQQPSPATSTLVSTAASTTSLTNLWKEPQIKADVSGVYMITSGDVEIPNAALQSEWMAFAGKTKYQTEGTDTVVSCDGQVTYDMAGVMQRMRPWVGNYANATGQRTEPLSFVYRMKNDPTGALSGTWADGLTASTKVSWDQGDVVGISLGQGSVPMTINNGMFATATEIPVSQGVVRWDISSNVAAEPLVVSQKPQVVLDHVAITPQMCQGWLKYVAPILSNIASIQGQLSLEIERAEIMPLDLMNQTVMGKLFVHGATVGPGPFSDQLIGIARQIKALRKGASLDPATINDDLWVQMPEQKVSFTVDRGMISHKDMQLKIGDVVINTSGGARLDGQLQMVASVPVLPDWVQENQYLAALAGKTIDLPIGGTIQQPRVDFAGLSSVAQQLISTAAQQAIQKQTDKAFNKLLGPIQEQLGPIQQQIQSLPNQLPQMPQLPQFSMPNLGLPGFGK
jgi:translocation and assembly module TamB